MFFTGIVFSWVSGMAQTSTGSTMKQPKLGYRTAKVLTLHGLQFKDLNRNEILDKYEDWRLAADLRAKDLLSKMTIEEKAGFMIISTTRLKNDWAFEAPKNKESDNQ